MFYYSFNNFLRERFGERVQKITLDAGMTCPNRDGTKGTGGCIYCDPRGSGNDGRKNIRTSNPRSSPERTFFQSVIRQKSLLSIFSPSATPTPLWKN